MQLSSFYVFWLAVANLGSRSLGLATLPRPGLLSFQPYASTAVLFPHGGEEQHLELLASATRQQLTFVLQLVQTVTWPKGMAYRPLTSFRDGGKSAGTVIWKASLTYIWAYGE